jgi:hypothetical protein
MPLKSTIIELGKKIKSSINREFLTYLVFLLIAVTIWYLNALNKDYTDELKFAVKYTDLPTDKVLVNTPPEQLTLTVNAPGFTLLKYKLGLIFNSVSLEANYQALRRLNHPTQLKYYILTQSVSEKINAQLSSDVNLKMVTPDTLNFQFSETVQKKIPVKSALQLQFEKGFFPKGRMAIDPKEVTVVGPQTIIDTLRYVYTRSKVFKKLNDDLHTTIDLQPVHYLRYSISEVKIVQVIERYTEAIIAVPIEPVNLPKGLTMKVFPGTVTVNCMVPVADYEKIQPYMFRAVVDYAGIKDDQAKARVALLRTPDDVTDIKFQPKTVDFIIEK